MSKSLDRALARMQLSDSPVATLLGPTVETRRDLEALRRKQQSDVSNLMRAAGVDIGDVKMTAAVVPPPGWLACDGTSYLRLDYPELFAALGGTSSPWGLPDGTHFNVPDYRGRVPIGAGAGPGLTSRALGNKVGSEPSNMPSHDHGGATGTMSANVVHNHSTAGNGQTLGSGTAYTSGANITTGGGSYGGTTFPVNQVNLDHIHGIALQGGGADNVPPASVVNFVIRYV